MLLIVGKCYFVVYLLGSASILNAILTFGRKRHYRLFEASVDTIPSTPSARRVRVDSSPIASSPLRFLSSVLGAETADSRAHPDQTRDVWELGVWDPFPVCLRLFCYFSPGHVLVYWLFLPVSPVDPRPSTTIATTILVALLLSVQLSAIQSNFSRQAKDSALIQKEVLHEYDTKYVHPRTQPLYRSVGTQYSMEARSSSARDDKYNFAETHTPMFIINRGFQTNPNPAYSKHVDPDSQARRPTQTRRLSSSSILEPQLRTAQFQTPAHLRDSSSPLRPNTAIRQPQFRGSVGPGGGDGGSLGVFTHAQSPLRKTQSTNFDARATGYNNEPSIARERSSMSPEKRLPRSSMPAGGMRTIDAARRYGHLGSGRRESGRF